MLRPCMWRAIVNLLCFLLSSSIAYAQTTITSAYPDFGDGRINGFELGGDSTLAGAASNELRLTRSVGGLYGTAYYKKLVNLQNDRSFSAHFSFKMADGYCFTGNGADGLAFVIQQTSNTAGSSGGGLGYAGVTPSFVVEFDTFNNGPTVGEPNNNHIGINIDGDTSSLAVYSPAEVLNNSSTYYAWVDYNGLTDTVEVRFNTSNVRPASSILSHSLDLAANLSSDVYVGFSAATGGCWETHTIQSFYFNNDTVSGGIVPAETAYTSAPSTVLLASDKSSIVGDGVETALLSATVLDINGDPVNGATVNFTTSLGTLSSPSAVTNASGVATVSLSATSAGSASVRAQVVGGAFEARSVDVTAVPTPAATSTPTPVPTQELSPTATPTPVASNVPTSKPTPKLSEAEKACGRRGLVSPKLGRCSEPNGRFLVRGSTVYYTMDRYRIKNNRDYVAFAIPVSTAKARDSRRTRNVLLRGPQGSRRAVFANLQQGCWAFNYEVRRGRNSVACSTTRYYLIR